MRAFLFSGQGSQKVDMAAPLLAQSGIVRRQYKTAAELVGYTLDDLTANELAETKNTQLAVTVYSAALWMPCRTKKNKTLFWPVFHSANIRLSTPPASSPSPI